MVRTSGHRTGRLEGSLEALSAQLRTRVRAVLIGGLAMRHYGVGGVTKDIDIVLATPSGRRHVITALEHLGFAPVAPVEDLDGEPSVVMVGPGRTRYDLFSRRVCDRLTLSRPMLGRARAVGLTGRLQLAVASPEDLFLLKGVTGRSGDLEDMAFLARMNLDWNAIASEVEAQPESWRWLGQFHASLSDLETEYEVLSPLKERYAREAEAITGVAALLPLLDRGPMRRGDIIEALETEDMGFVEAVIIKAVDIGAAEYGRGRLRKTTGRPASGDGHKGRG